MKNILFSIVGLLISAMFTLLILEIFLQFFPVNEGLRAQKVNADNPVFKFKPNRTAVYSKNWNFDIHNEVKVNNVGFINHQDYFKSSGISQLSIIGDSYVEALMVPFKKTISGLLADKAVNKNVYSFAASGAGLSQHLIWAEYAKNNFNSDYFIFVIISNDFSESIAKYESSPGFHRFKLNEDKSWELQLTEYEPSLLRRLFRNSKLAMYLITNLKIHSILDVDLKLGKNDKRVRYVSNFNADVSKAFWKEAMLVTDIYLNNIEKFSGVNKKKILFVLDGIRPQLYNWINNKEISNSFWFKIREYFISQANQKDLK